jgi:ABC-2 type transport system permease protein
VSRRAPREASPPEPPRWPVQVALLVGRSSAGAGRNPVLALNLVLAVFFLLVYDGSLGGAPAVVDLVGGNFYNFILPAAVLAAAVAGGAAGLILVNDIQRTYLQRQLTMPVHRSAIMVSAVMVGALQVALQAIVVLGFGVLLGAEPRTGVAGLAVVVVIALIWGLGFAGYSVMVGVLTRDVQLTSAAGLLFVPLIFMSPLLVPASELKPWVRFASSVNPASYVVEGMRALIIRGWEVEPIVRALAASVGFAAVMLSGAILVARWSFRRGF